MWTDQDEQRTVRLTFDEFGWDLVGEASRDRGWTTDELVSDACRAYGDRLFDSAFSCEVPRLGERFGSTRTVRIAIAQRLWADIEMEAGRQGVGLETLIEHALMLRLADREGQVRRSRSLTIRRRKRR